MKKHKILFLLVILGLLAVPTFAQKTDIFGYYTIVKATKAFADISVIHLGGDYGEQQNPPFYGLIRLESKSAKDFQLNESVMNGKNITFSTESVGNISYKFVGAFTKLGDFPILQPNGEVILKGTLSKYRGKKRIASANVKFSYEAGD